MHANIFSNPNHIHFSVPVITPLNDNYQLRPNISHNLLTAQNIELIDGSDKGSDDEIIDTSDVEITDSSKEYSDDGIIDGTEDGIIDGSDKGSEIY